MQSSLSNARNHGYQVKKTPEEIEREIKAQEAELQKLLQESVGFVFFRIFSFFEFAQHRLICKRMPLYNSHHFETQVHLKLPSTALWFEPPTIVRWALSKLWGSWQLLLWQPPLLKNKKWRSNKSSTTDGTKRSAIGQVLASMGSRSTRASRLSRSRCPEVIIVALVPFVCLASHRH